MPALPSHYHRVVAKEAGDSSVLSYEPAKTEDTVLPTGDDLLVKLSFAGINYIDTYFRSGLYKKPEGFPLCLGQEGVGIVVAAGPKVQKANEWLGKRVAFYGSETGSYAQYVRLKTSDAFVVPEGVTDKDAAAALLQGCTAHYLTHDSHPVKAGDVVLVHAAAGGTGLLVTQMAKQLGAGLVIGVCGGAEKAALARSVGKCDEVIDYSATPDWEQEVLRITNQAKCHVIFDGVGKSTFAGSLRSLRPRGHMVTFGNASGPIDPIAPLILSTHGSLSLTRPKLQDYMLTREEAEARVAAVLGLIADKKVALTVASTFPLEQAAAAQQLLESRGSVGKIVLEIPQNF